jgi:hypothetical protein
MTLPTFAPPKGGGPTIDDPQHQPTPHPSTNSVLHNVRNVFKMLIAQ